MGRMKFNHAGDKVVIAQDGSAVVVRVAGGVEETFREADLDHGNAPIAEFVGVDDVVIVLEDEDLGRMRTVVTAGNRGGAITPGVHAPRAEPRCNPVTSISGARGADVLAYVCGGGAVHVRNPFVPWDAPILVARGLLAGLDAAELSADGRFLAATEGDRVHVFDVRTGGRSTPSIRAPATATTARTCTGPTAPC